MSEKVLNKLRNKIAITDGKEDGHGIGMGQVRRALEENDGTMQIESKVDKGTTITLRLPIIPTPDWLVREVVISKGDTIIILDDDPSIHGVWDGKFEDYRKIVNIQHFTNGEETIDFIKSKKLDRKKVILLTDYELVSQKLDGLSVAEKTKIPRTILVTSHFDNLKIRQGIVEANIKLLPKQMATDILIKEVESVDSSKSKKSANKTKTVILDDDNIFADGLQGILEKSGKKADVYNNGKGFLEEYAKYPKETKFCLDYNIGNVTGLEIAKILNQAGYNNLYLLTGYDEDVIKDKVKKLPDYIIKVLSKTNIDEVIEVLS